MGQPVVHFEVIGKDPRRLQDYYAELFGWDIDADNALDYGFVTREGNVRADGSGIGGGIAGPPTPDYPGHVTFYVEVPDREKADALARVLKAENPRQAIIFGRTKIGVDRLARSLNDKGVRVKALHGDMSQGSRDGVMIAFKDGRERLLVATDISARGLDITGVSHVINYDIPNSPEVYVHRIGRTGRVGRSGRAITFVRLDYDHEAAAASIRAVKELPEYLAQRLALGR